MPICSGIWHGRTAESVTCSKPEGELAATKAEFDRSLAIIGGWWTRTQAMPIGNKT
jgi:hypothetical protein